MEDESISLRLSSRDVAQDVARVSSQLSHTHPLASSCSRPCLQRNLTLPCELLHKADRLNRVNVN